jgi:hypothetical protein
MVRVVVPEGPPRRWDIEIVGTTLREWMAAVTWCRWMLWQAPDSICRAIADGVLNAFMHRGQLRSRALWTREEECYRIISQISS